ncbi:hypothetical protein [Shewanella japonica]|uniref:hypothetical protein n=1 Tax=Shewanella japonica TaxID=93973 RepID=UPI00249419E6|nr:hypothetical protein [Shewanella japonica]
MTFNVFIKRLLILAVVLNLPPIITPLILLIGLEPTLLIMSLGVWVNIPQLFGVQLIIDTTQLSYGSFGLNEAPTIVWFAITLFWTACAAVSSALSLIIFKAKPSTQL